MWGMNGSILLVLALATGMIACPTVKDCKQELVMEMAADSAAKDFKSTFVRTWNVMYGPVDPLIEEYVVRK